VGYSEQTASNVELEGQVMKPLLKGDDVKRYRPLKISYHVLYPHYEKDGKTHAIPENIFQARYPLAYAYLKPFQPQLTQKKIKYKTNPRYWYSLHRSREISMFEQTKIITPEISLGTNMTLDTDNLYHNTKCYSLVKNNAIAEDYKFWLAILNSSLMWFFLHSTGYVLRGGFFTFKTKYLEPFPLPKLANTNDQQPLVALVDEILSLKKKNEDANVSQQESQIDQIIYQLYDLTPDEIAIVERRDT